MITRWININVTNGNLETKRMSARMHTLEFDWLNEPRGSMFPGAWLAAASTVHPAENAITLIRPAPGQSHDGKNQRDIK